MPRNLVNWSFKDVVTFLSQHFFVEAHRKATGHYYFKGLVDKDIKLIEVQFHSNGYISIKSLQHDIIPKSGIPKDLWKKWANAGNKKARKRIQYKGAELIS
ncbi:MAG: hypothetical protein V1880_02065 [Patescibacteria group bacterium]